MRKILFIRKAARHAFTLIEILLGLTVFSAIALTVYGAFSTGIRVESRARELHEFCREARLAFDLLPRELENAFLYDFSGSDIRPPFSNKISFQGKPDRVIFLVSGKDGIKAVEYGLGTPDWGTRRKTIIGLHANALKSVVAHAREEAPDECLLRREIPWPAFVRSSDEGVEEEIIASGIKKGGLKFFYSAKLKENDPHGSDELPFQWQDSWDEPGLPAAVRIAMTFLDRADSRGAGVVLTREMALPVRMDDVARDEVSGASVHKVRVRHLGSVKEMNQ